MVEPNLHGYYQIEEERFLVKWGEEENRTRPLYQEREEGRKKGRKKERKEGEERNDGRPRFDFGLFLV